jgi:hypothetical protein
MASVISGAGFHGRRGKSVRDGELCEALVRVACEIAFPVRGGWEVIPQWSPKHVDDSFQDTFDLGVFLRPEQTVPKRALILQITKWDEGESVKEEPNKSYEVHETLEEFTYLGSRVRIKEPTTRDMPRGTAFGSVIFGNRNYVRKWIPLHLVRFLDFVSFPSYLDGGNKYVSSLYSELRLLDAQGSDLEEVRKLMEAAITREEATTLHAVGSCLVRELQEFERRGFPLSLMASTEYAARKEYRRSARYASDLRFLRDQIESGGMPINRFKVKASRGTVDLTQLPMEWRDLIRAIQETSNRVMPENEILRQYLKSIGNEIRRVAKLLMAGEFESLANEWDTTDVPKRMAFRSFLSQLYSGPVEDFYRNGVTEQNLTSGLFDRNVTDAILERICLSIRRKTGGTITEAFVRETAERVQLLLKYKIENGTKNQPTEWALEYLLRGVRTGTKVVKRGGSWKAFTFDAFAGSEKDTVLSRLGTRIEAAHAPSLKAEFTVGKTPPCFLKSKPTTNEEGRRAKEEGNKAWLGRVTFKMDNKGNMAWRFTDTRFCIWVDGNWENKIHLERLTECGWRVYLDPRTLVSEVGQ